MGKPARRKGASYENQIASELRVLDPHFFGDAKRHLEYQTPEADAGRDLDGTEPFAIQCKCHKRTPPLVSILNVKTDEWYRVPLAFLKRTQSKNVPGFEVVVIEKEWFYKLLKHAAAHGVLAALLFEDD